MAIILLKHRLFATSQFCPRCKNDYAMKQGIGGGRGGGGCESNHQLFKNEEKLIAI